MPLTLSGSGAITGATSGVGKVLQVVQTVKTNSFSTNSTSYVDVTGLSLSITPSSSTSKILVFANTTMSIADNQTFYVQLVRDSTAIGSSNSGGWYTHRFSGFVAGGAIPTSINFLDSPNTTSSLTYKVQASVSGDTGYIGTMRLNFSLLCTSVITAMEIAS